MVEFKSQEDIEAWLQERAPEDTALLATRTSLRELPRLLSTDDFVATAESMANFLIAAGILWYSLAQPDHVPQLARPISTTIDIVESTLQRLRSLRSMRTRQSPPQFVARLKSDASIAEREIAIKQDQEINAHYNAAVDAVSMAETLLGHLRELEHAQRTGEQSRANIRVPEVYPEMLSAISDDATKLEQGLPASLLVHQPLWLGQRPQQARADWIDFRDRLLRKPSDAHWDVWIEWYQARLRGDPNPDMALEKARVLIDEDLWNQGPAAMNSEIADLIEKHDPVGFELAQIRRNVRRVLAAKAQDAAISDFRHEAGTGAWQTIPLQNEWDARLCDAALAARGTELGALASDCRAIAATLSHQSSNVGEDLPRHLNAYGTAAEGRDGQPDFRGLWESKNMLMSDLSQPDIIGALGEEHQRALDAILKRHDTLIEDGLLPPEPEPPVSDLSPEEEQEIDAASEAVLETAKQDADLLPPPLAALAKDWTLIQSRHAHRIATVRSASERTQIHVERAQMGRAILATIRRGAWRSVEYALSTQPSTKFAAAGFVLIGQAQVVALLSISSLQAVGGLAALVAAFTALQARHDACKKPQTDDAETE